MARYRAVHPFLRLVHRLQVDPDLLYIHFHHPRGRANDQYSIPLMQWRGLYEDFRHAELREPVRDLAAIDLLPRGLATVDLAPLAKPRPRILTIPDTSVEHL